VNVIIPHRKIDASFNAWILVLFIKLSFLSARKNESQGASASERQSFDLKGLKLLKSKIIESPPPDFQSEALNLFAQFEPATFRYQLTCFHSNAFAKSASELIYSRTLFYAECKFFSHLVPLS